ncbi:cytochrome C oxidase subunit IV family protein [Pseudomonas sp. JV449]|uniref:cytochrome C oxidase subunit IV family protein n=1 Tax=Pseudomonas sp. JV449 TaxID=1890658 RepID=UPI0028E12177|nr:cytochrome C oxidase subunit IV family protein [Pseudomonas sp. JV449]MDT9633053.1 cytochrome C oxidase subunit IV family protein [Pseudomonas sp. JV449]
MTDSQTLILCWLMLVVLSVGTVLTGASGLWWGVLLLAVVKGWVIVDGFMELRRGPWLWRFVMVGWVGVLIALVGLSTYPFFR